MLREQWGCDRELPANGPGGDFLELKACGLQGRERITRCPRVTTPGIAFTVLSTYQPWKLGVPVVAGAMGDQAAWWIDAVDCLDLIFQNMQEKPGE